MEKKVEIEESILVVPSEETPNKTIWLSNLDLALANKKILYRASSLGPFYTSDISLYRYNGDSTFFSVQILKAALAKALVIFYPFAGRLVSDENGRLELKCTGEGVRFTVAQSKYTVDEFDPSSNKSHQLVPRAESKEPPFILAMFQITYLKCGGVCIGSTYHHGCADGHILHHFRKTWCQIARGIELPKSLTLSYDRTIFKARSPPKIHYDHGDEYKVKPKTSMTIETTKIVTEVLKISEEQLHSLKMQLQRPTTFTAVLAHVWKCTCLARGLHGDDETRLFMTVSVRSRMTPMLPQGYFGNAIVRTIANAHVGDILSHPLGFAADKINEAVASVDDDYVRSIIDFIEVLGVHKYHEKYVDHNRGGTKTNLLAVSWLRFSLDEYNFGWGKPMLKVKTHLESDGVVYLGKNLDGGVTMMVAFESETMEKFKSMFYKDLNRTFSRI